jgi:hypothetical protein
MAESHIIRQMEQMEEEMIGRRQNNNTPISNPILKFFAMKKYCFYSIMLILILALELLKLSGGIRTRAEELMYELFKKNNSNIS